MGIAVGNCSWELDDYYHIRSVTARRKSLTKTWLKRTECKSPKTGIMPSQHCVHIMSRLPIPSRCRDGEGKPWPAKSECKEFSCKTRQRPRCFPAISRQGKPKFETQLITANGFRRHHVVAVWARSRLSASDKHRHVH